MRSFGLIVAIVLLSAPGGSTRTEAVWNGGDNPRPDSATSTADDSLPYVEVPDYIEFWVEVGPKRRPSRDSAICWRPLDVDLIRWVTREMPAWDFPKETDYDSRAF